MILYDWIVLKILPLFGDLSFIIFKSYHFSITGLDIFNLFFAVALSFILISVVLFAPYKFMKWIFNGCKRRKK